MRRDTPESKPIAALLLATSARYGAVPGTTTSRIGNAPVLSETFPGLSTHS
jgi:hypothetical protein